jgi:cation-transporting ATPase I
MTGTRSRANTIALLALVGTQLGQTISSGGASRPVITTSVSSAATLAAIVQTPFISQLFGCRPIGPLGWATAVGASALATGAGIYVPKKARELFAERRVRNTPTAFEPQALPGVGLRS